MGFLLSLVIYFQSNRIFLVSGDLFYPMEQTNLMGQTISMRQIKSHPIQIINIQYVCLNNSVWR